MIYSVEYNCSIILIDLLNESSYIALLDAVSVRTVRSLWYSSTYCHVLVGCVEIKYCIPNFELAGLFFKN